VTATVTAASIQLLGTSASDATILAIDGIVSLLLLALVAIRQIGRADRTAASPIWMRSMNAIIVPLLIVDGLLLTLYLSLALAQS